MFFNLRDVAINLLWAVIPSAKQTVLSMETLGFSLRVPPWKCYETSLGPNKHYIVFFFSALLLLTHVFSTGTFISKIGKELLGEEKEKIQVF